MAFWPEVIVDQHVIARKREFRLRQAIGKHHWLIGFGLDESVAIIVTRLGLKVMGRSKVILVQ